METIQNEGFTIVIIIPNGATIKEDSPRHGLLTVQDFQGCLRIKEDYKSTPLYQEDMEETGSLHGGRRKDASTGDATFAITCKTILALLVAREKSTRDCRTSIYLHGKVKCRRE